jgi:hypothetical protein
MMRPIFQDFAYVGGNDLYESFMMRWSDDAYLLSQVRSDGYETACLKIFVPHNPMKVQLHVFLPFFLCCDRVPALLILLAF